MNYKAPPCLVAKSPSKIICIWIEEQEILGKYVFEIKGRPAQNQHCYKSVLLFLSTLKSVGLALECLSWFCCRKLHHIKHVALEVGSA